MISTEFTRVKRSSTGSVTRAYVLLQSSESRHNQVTRILKRQLGVVTVDSVEGPSDIVMVIEAPDRRELASVLMNALTSVQDTIEDMELLPIRVSHSDIKKWAG